MLLINCGCPELEMFVHLKISVLDLFGWDLPKTAYKMATSTVIGQMK